MCKAMGRQVIVAATLALMTSSCGGIEQGGDPVLGQNSESLMAGHGLMLAMDPGGIT